MPPTFFAIIFYSYTKEIPKVIHTNQLVNVQIASKQ